MPRFQPARAVEWRKRPGEPKRWYFFFRDAAGVQKRILCTSMGASNATQRAKIVRQLREQEKRDTWQREQLGFSVAFNTPLRDALQDYEKHVHAKAKQREQSGGREGLAHASVLRIFDTLTPFVEWLASNHPRLKTGQLDGRHLEQAVADCWGATTPSNRNLHRRNLKTCLTWLSRLRPKLFPDDTIFWPALKQVAVQPTDATALTPEQLQSAREKLRRDQQHVFDFIALTGCRLGEAESLTWADVDLDRGRITFRAAKTARARVLPLLKAEEGAVAPSLLKRLKQREKRGLPPCGDFARGHWTRAGVPTPQVLRRNFTSYAAAVGIPAAVCALWQGHSLAVAERFYRQQVLDRLPGKSIEAAMGL